MKHYKKPPYDHNLEHLVNKIQNASNVHQVNTALIAYRSCWEQYPEVLNEAQAAKFIEYERRLLWLLYNNARHANKQIQIGDL